MDIPTPLDYYEVRANSYSYQKDNQQCEACDNNSQVNDDLFTRYRTYKYSRVSSTATSTASTVKSYNQPETVDF